MKRVHYVTRFFEVKEPVFIMHEKIRWKCSRKKKAPNDKSVAERATKNK